METVAPGMLALVESTTWPTRVGVGPWQYETLENAKSKIRQTSTDLVTVCIANFLRNFKSIAEGYQGGLPAAPLIPFSFCLVACCGCRCFVRGRLHQLHSVAIQVVDFNHMLAVAQLMDVRDRLWEFAHRRLRRQSAVTFGTSGAERQM